MTVACFSALGTGSVACMNALVALRFAVVDTV